MTDNKKTKFFIRAILLFGVIALFSLNTANAALIHNSTHIYGFGADPTAVEITLNLYDGQPGGRYLWNYNVLNNGYDPNPGSSNGFSGFEIYLPTGIPEIADIMPNLLSATPWEVDGYSGHPVEWDRKNSMGFGVMPGSSADFSFTTDPRDVAVNNNGWFHTWQNNIQTDIVGTPGMHVPWVPGLTPITQIPEPSSMFLLGVGLLGVATRTVRRKKTV